MRVRRALLGSTLALSLAAIALPASAQVALIPVQGTLLDS